MREPAAQARLVGVVPAKAPVSKSEFCRITELAPDRCPAWDAYVSARRDGTFFHTLAWRQAVREAFGHESVYLVAKREGRLVGVLPLLQVASRIAGRMLVSVPYGVGGGIVADDEAVARDLFEAARAAAEQRHCPTIDLRSERALIDDLPVVDRYVGFRRALPEQADEVLAWLPRKARAAVRNARDKYGLTVAFGDEHLKEVWRLYALSMRRLASLTYPYRFFDRLVAHTPDRHWVCVVEWDGRVVAGLVTFLFKDTVLPYFVGTIDAAKRCSAANFIYYCVMTRAVEEGYHVFDFGRSRRDNTGSCNFKRFNGFQPHSLAYQVFRADGRPLPNLSPSNPKFRLVRRVWGHLPLWLTRSVGAYVSRHIPG
jgi:FemAB-related protein (PEP-CTERM system-associated)